MLRYNIYIYIYIYTLYMISNTNPNSLTAIYGAYYVA